MLTIKILANLFLFAKVIEYISDNLVRAVFESSLPKHPIFSFVGSLLA
jgi:hypothetical protein